jgi:HAD superfamily hydrolase (TIGR01549 family)
MKLKALLLDLDDTLIDSEGIYARVLARLGLAGADSAYWAARQRVKTRLGVGSPAARNRLLYFKAMQEAAGAWSARGLLELMGRYEVALEEEVRQDWERRGRAELLGKLAARCQLVVVTNENTRTQLIKLRAMDPEGKLFRRVVTSEEAGAEKPAEAIFRAALEGLDAASTGMVGDDPATDLAPARKLGLKAFLSRELRGAQAGAADPGVTELRSLEEILPWV